MSKIAKFSALCFAGTLFVFGGVIQTQAATLTGETPVAGVNLTLANYYDTKLTVIEDTATISATSLSEQYSNLAIADVTNHLNIRKGPGENNAIIGHLPKDAGCEIIEEEDGWAKIKSGKVTGYVSMDYLITGDEAQEKALEVGYFVATSNCITLNIREEANTECKILTQVPIEEELEVLEDDTIGAEWVKIQLDNEKAYVAREFVEISFQLKKAVSAQELSADSANGITSLRVNMVAFAKKYLGNRYVYGWTSLNGGIDCSAYTQAIYRQFGYSINRTSYTQVNNGTKISPSQLRPGDLVFYSSGSRISHVAMYIGGGQIIHASNPRDGIKISNMYYKTPYAYRRIIND